MKMQQSRSDILLDKEIFRSEQKVKPELVFGLMLHPYDWFI